MLELVGERSYAEVTVADVLERSGSNRAQFYAAFGGKDACFEAAYDDALGALLELLLGSCHDPVPWARKVRGALEELTTFIAEEPGIARGIFSGARAAGNGVDRIRRETLELLARAVDEGRSEIGTRSPPPPITARFIVGVVEAAVLQYLEAPAGRDFGAEIRDVLYLVIEVYLGSEAATAEVRAFRPGAEGAA